MEWGLNTYGSIEGSLDDDGEVFCGSQLVLESKEMVDLSR